MGSLWFSSKCLLKNFMELIQKQLRHFSAVSREYRTQVDLSCTLWMVLKSSITLLCDREVLLGLTQTGCLQLHHMTQSYYNIQSILSRCIIFCLLLCCHDILALSSLPTILHFRSTVGCKTPEPSFEKNCVQDQEDMSQQ